MNLYMFRAVPLPIIKSSLTVHLALVYVIRFEVSLRAGPAESQEIRGRNLPGTPRATSACRGTPLLHLY